MGSGLIKAGMRDGRCGGSGWGGGEVKKCWKYNIAGKVAFRGSGERGRIKTKMKLIKCCIVMCGRERRSSIGSSQMTFDPKLFMIKKFSHPSHTLHISLFRNEKETLSAQMSSCAICRRVAKHHLVSCWRKKKTLRKVEVRSNLDNHFLAGMRCSYKFEQIGYIFHKLSDSSEERLTWCLQFMQGIWDRIQRTASKCSISSAGSELQREREERGRGGSLQRMPRKTGEKWKMDKL